MSYDKGYYKVKLKPWTIFVAYNKALTKNTVYIYIYTHEKL